MSRASNPCFSLSRSILSISSIPRTHIMIKPYWYSWWRSTNADICAPKFITMINKRNMLIINIFPFLPAQSAKALWSGLRYLACNTANPPTMIIKRIIKILDSGIPSIVGSATLSKPTSNILSAVKSITKSPSHWMDGYLSSILAIHPDSVTMSTMERTSPIMSIAKLCSAFPATARTLSSDIATSAMMIVLIAAESVAASLTPSSACSCDRISR